MDDGWNDLEQDLRRLPVGNFQIWRIDLYCTCKSWKSISPKRKTAGTLGPSRIHLKIFENESSFLIRTMSQCLGAKFQVRAKLQSSLPNGGGSRSFCVRSGDLRRPGLRSDSKDQERFALRLWKPSQNLYVCLFLYTSIKGASKPLRSGFLAMCNPSWGFPGWQTCSFRPLPTTLPDSRTYHWCKTLVRFYRLREREPFRSCLCEIATDAPCWTDLDRGHRMFVSEMFQLK